MAGKEKPVQAPKTKTVRITGCIKPCVWKNNLWDKSSKYPKDFVLAADEAPNKYLKWVEVPDNKPEPKPEPKPADDDLMG